MLIRLRVGNCIEPPGFISHIVIYSLYWLKRTILGWELNKLMSIQGIVLFLLRIGNGIEPPGSISHIVSYSFIILA